MLSISEEKLANKPIDNRSWYLQTIYTKIDKSDSLELALFVVDVVEEQLDLKELGDDEGWN